ncbi:MAG: type II toxin-antitoxin system RelE/ParE family toxin [Sulfurisoma sp.]|nr:type II toxin-antitoxin system RelE/ParE family toxin [Sulfurisoma sp.]
MKPLAQRQRAQRDIEIYPREAGANVAAGWIAALDVAFRHIRRHPGTGSTRHAELLDIPGLRHWRLDRFPYAVFYLERDAGIDILRVSHQARDIPTQLGDDPAT